MKKRIGNDIQFTWHIYRKSGEEQVPESFDGKDVEVKLISPLQRPVTIEDVTIATGVVTFTFKGKHQVTLGNYVAILQENRGENNMVTLDVVDAVTLVPHSYMEEDDDEGDVIEATSVELTSEITAGGGGGIEQQQADWAQTDASAVDFIKNKPDLNVYVPKTDDDGHGNMSFYSPGTITMTLADEQGSVIQGGTFGAGGWSVYSPQGRFQTFGNSIYRGTMGFDHDSVVWEKTATQQIPTATTSANGLMAAVDKSKLNDLPTDAELTQELAGKQNTIDDLSAIRSGAQAGATAYQLPNTGIPATDLASDVQTDLAAIDGIEAVIPEQASSSNQLADKDFVNSSIATATATYRGSYNLVSDLSLTVSATQQQIADALATKMTALSITPDNNDYCFIQIPTADATPTEIARIDRYKYDGTEWSYEYSLNNSSFTAAQWAAINSDITSGLVTKLSDLPTATELATLLAGKASTEDLAVYAMEVDLEGYSVVRENSLLAIDNKGLVFSYGSDLDYKVIVHGDDITISRTTDLPERNYSYSLKNVASTVYNLATVATSGSYNDLSDKPTIPTVPTNVSAFTNDAGYLTLHQDISGKADKVSGATNGNFAALDSNGNLTDSGHKHSDYLTQHQDLSNYVQKSNTTGLLKNDGTVDTTQYLTQHQDISGKADKSEMSVVPGTGANADKTTITLKQGTSATVLTSHQDITGKENVMPITTATGATLSAVVGNYYRLDNVGTLAITLPTITGATKIQAITFLLVCGSSALVTFVPQDSETILYQEDFALEANTTYEVTALWNGSEWTLTRVIYE